jgi:23S rRNA (adenine2503-C2)-methyltransferase
MTPLPDLRLLTLAELTAQLAAWGEPAYRAKQVWAWLWQQTVNEIDEMSNLSKALRQRLKESYTYHRISEANRQTSKDGTIKYGFRLHDGPLIESVLIPTASRVTVCVSSQAGCSLSCKFCATGYMPLTRNLHPYEIFDQVELLRREAELHYGRPLTNIVYMGMGEPLLNYKHVQASIERVTAEDGLGMSPRRITVSTAGISKMIKKLADDGFRCEFAVSLHAANDVKRSEIMPINDSNTLDALAESLVYFTHKTGTRVTFEYITFDGFNDSIDDARELAEFAHRMPSKVNIIEYNPIGEADYKFTSYGRLDAFKNELERLGHIVNVRRSRGRDVDGACGQLAIKQEKAALVSA